MRHFFGAACFALTILSGPAFSEGTAPVVVELFTSQGCNACPPADELARKLDEEPGLLVLSFHVNYWDYIGWTDTFADPSNGRRQKKYAKNFGEKMVYTPQMVIQGSAPVVGNRGDEVARLVSELGARPARVEVRLEKSGEELEIHVRPLASGVGDAELYLIRYLPLAEVEIRRGENAGRALTYSNIVQEWHVLGNWPGDAPAELTVPVPGDLSTVVMVQKRGQGEVLAAARAR